MSRGTERSRGVLLDEACYAVVAAFERVSSSEITRTDRPGARFVLPRISEFEREGVYFGGVPCILKL